MTPMTPTELNALADRLSKRAEQEHEIAENSRVVAGLLMPQREAFNDRGSFGWNTYAVRMQIDHERNALKDDAFATDLERAAQSLRARAASLLTEQGA